VPWLSRQALQPDIIGGNQQGFVEFLDETATNDESLAITGITGSLPTVVITSYDHNLVSNQVIQVLNIAATDPFFALNEGIYGINVLDANSFEIFLYNPNTQKFDTPIEVVNGVYFSAGRLAIRDNFSIISKKFNFAEEGQNIQMGYLDILMDTTSDGAINLNVYLNYNDSQPINQLAENQLPDPSTPTLDTFFNTVVPTNDSSLLESSKEWKRVFCPVRGAFITIEWNLSNAQLVGVEQECDVQIDAQILYVRRAGKQLPVGI